MLRQRVVTAAVLLLIVFGAIFLLPRAAFTAFLGTVVLIGAWEWSRLAGLVGLPARLGYLAGVALLLGVSQQMLAHSLPPVLLAGLLWWLLAFGLILAYPRLARWWGRPGFLAAAGLLVLVPAWLSFLYLRRQDDYALLILLLLALVAAADIGAYFTGRALGRHKLAPRVSPNKTWEGFWGGVAACCILMVLVGLGVTLAGTALTLGDWVRLLVYAALLGMVSVVGDLLESMVKRQRDIKDSGNILPGHGGILDRIDSITAAAPVYALMVMSIGADLV